MQSTSTSRGKRAFRAAAFAALLGLGAASAGAYTVDTLLGSDDLSSSGDAAVTAALEAAAGLAPGSLELDYSLSQDDADFNVTWDAASSAWVINVAPDTPGYFVLKFGNLPQEDVDNFYFFQNIGEMTALVFTNAQVNYISGCDDAFLLATCSGNIGKLSHYSVTTSIGSSSGGPGSGTVPEPASSTLALLGLGLIGASLRARKSRRS